MITTAFYDPKKSYYENYEKGPFGDFANDDVFEPKHAPNEVFLQQSVHTRFGIPAGPLLNGTFVIAALNKGFDIPVYKTVRSGVRECHPAPNVLPLHLEGNLTLEQANAGLVTKDTYTEPLSITNSFGVPSFAPDVWQPDFIAAKLHAKKGQLVGLSFEGTKQSDGLFSSYLADWKKTAQLVADVQPDFAEANLSCPNEGTGDLLCFDINRVVEIVTELKAELLGIPLFLKISYFADQALLERFVKEVGPLIDGVATINTLSAEVRTPDGEQALPGEGRLRSGICGHAIKWAGIDMVTRFAALRREHNLYFNIIGVGGVTSATDYTEYIAAGADVVMSATGAMWNPHLGQEVYDLTHTS